MLKKYKILTVTHRTTSLQDLANFVVSYTESAELKEKLHRLRDQFALPELLYLATCNRVMYFFPTEQNISLSDFFRAVNPKHQFSDEQLTKMIRCYEGQDALQHLYEVAASIDSMVVGEREILRQLREAYQQCQDWGLTGDDIRVAMKFAVQTAKSVYANTRIGEKPVSVVSLATQKLLQANLARNARILMIGAGQTNNLMAKFLAKHEFTNVTVVNRTLGRAETVAKLVNGKSLPLDHLGEYQTGFDCLIVCTGATQAIVDTELYQKLLAGETDTKIVIDLAIPYNIDQAIVEQFPVQYIEIEGLRQLARQNLDFREQEVEKGKEIIHHNLTEFHTLYQERQIEKAMQEVPSQIKAVKAHAMNKVFKKEIETLDEHTLDLLHRMLNYMEKRCISIPMQAAKKTIS